jgi:hypothetical protein
MSYKFRSLEPASRLSLLLLTTLPTNLRIIFLGTHNINNIPFRPSTIQHQPKNIHPRMAHSPSGFSQDMETLNALRQLTIADYHRHHVAPNSAPGAASFQPSLPMRQNQNRGVTTFAPRATGFQSNTPTTREQVPENEAMQSESGSFHPPFCLVRPLINDFFRRRRIEAPSKREFTFSRIILSVSYTQQHILFKPFQPNRGDYDATRSREPSKQSEPAANSTL